MKPVLSWSFLRSRRYQVVTLLLVIQAAVLFGSGRKEIIPSIPPLRYLPEQVANWQLISEAVVDPEALQILNPDDHLVRDYQHAGSRRLANLFVAYFKTQRSERMPHSPKNCLPGNGWIPSSYSSLTVPIDGHTEPVHANSYIVSKGTERSVVLYWYQSWNRTVANEYMARLYLAADAMRYNRTDTALVRLMVPIPDDGDSADYQKTAIDFLHAIYPQLEIYFPKS